MDTTEKACPALSDEQLRDLWLEVGGDFYWGSSKPDYAQIDEAKLFLFLRSFAERIKVEERERCAQVCAAVEDELRATVRKHEDAHRHYEDYAHLDREADTVSIVKDRIRAPVDAPSAAASRAESIRSDWSA
jgi:hypothetical protein